MLCWASIRLEVNIIKFLKVAMNTKQTILFFLLIPMNLAYGMDFFALDRCKHTISPPAIAGITFFGLGICKAVETRLRMGFYSTILDETIKEVEVVKGYDRSIIMVGIGVAMLKWSAHD